jgi:hypothetical protein
MSDKHIPVLLDDVVDVLAPRDGAGGYSRALLEAADCTVWGIDRDPEAAEAGNRLAQNYGQRLTVLKGRFGDMRELLAGVGVHQVDGIALDLGVSSMQIDEPARGFSFRFDGPLDMRMEKDGLSAADAVNRLAEKELATARNARRARSRGPSSSFANNRRSPAPASWPNSCAAWSGVQRMASIRQRARFRRSGSTSTRSWPSWTTALQPPKNYWASAAAWPWSRSTHWKAAP